MTTEAVDTQESRPDTPDAPTADARKPSRDTESFFCYIGPGITGLIQHGTIFRGTREEAMAAAAAAIEKYPSVKSLIVSGDRLPAARLKVKKPGNALYQSCQRILGKA